MLGVRGASPETEVLRVQAWWLVLRQFLFSPCSEALKLPVLHESSHFCIKIAYSFDFYFFLLLIGPTTTPGKMLHICGKSQFPHLGLTLENVSVSMVSDVGITYLLDLTEFIHQEKQGLEDTSYDRDGVLTFK